MELKKLTPRQALIYDALIPTGRPVRGKDLARRTRISERDLRSERKAMQEQGVTWGTCWWMRTIRSRCCGTPSG